MMAYMRRTLVVLTLLQLSRAEISNTPESWYSANVISDSFQPKPISEIFSTEATFSSTNPIIVLPKSTMIPDDVEAMSTLPPPTPQVTFTSASGAISQTSTTPSPLPTQTTTTHPLPTNFESSSSLPSQTPTVTFAPPTSTLQTVTQAPSILPPQEVYQEVLPISPTAPQYEHPLSEFQPEHIDFVSSPDQPTYEISQPSLESLFLSINQQSYIPVMSLNNESETPLVQEPLNSQQITTQQPSLSTEVTTREPTIPWQSTLPVQTTLSPSSTIFSEPSSVSTPVPNQSSSSEMPRQEQEIRNPQLLPPQIVNGLPVPTNSDQWQQIKFEVVPQSSRPVLSQPNQSGATGQSVSTQQPLSNYFMIYQQAPQSFQSYPLRQLMGPSPPQSPATLSPPPSTLPSSTTFSPSPTVVTQVPPQTTRPPVSTHQPVTSISPPIVMAANTSPTLRPSGAVPGIPLIPMRIRVVSPSGSITNIQIKPKVVPTTTTRRPTTTRTRKPRPKKNTYDYCVNSCKGPINPICAAPISTIAIDPETLKGFPSICHMACHNSYRKKPYEMIADGRCGRLRMKIRPLDSNAKLKRNELVKAEYSIDHSGQKAVIEVSSGVRP